MPRGLELPDALKVEDRFADHERSNAVRAPLLELVQTTREPSGPTGRTFEKPHKFLKFGPVKV
jgi:hypothetical protein